MKNKLIMLCLTFVLLFLLVGCTTTSESCTEVQEENPYFTVVEEWQEGLSHYQIVYANDTNVKYLLCVYRGVNLYGHSMTPLYNADGTLQIYEGE